MIKIDKNNIGDYVVTNDGIHEIINIDDKGWYTTKKVIDKQAFIIAYRRYILGEEADECTQR